MRFSEQLDKPLHLSDSYLEVLAHVGERCLTLQRIEFLPLSNVGESEITNEQKHLVPNTNGLLRC